ncbi:MAG: hypothetical protein ACAI44_11575 [Candidatus Sericytochromatia bacterium]
MSRLLADPVLHALVACFAALALLPASPAATADQAVLAEAESQTQGLRRQKPWLVELSLAMPRSGPGLYYHLADQWAIGTHLLPPLPWPIPGSNAYSVSGRYYFSSEGLSFFLEPSVGVLPFGVVDYTTNTTSGDYHESPGLLAALELGMNYRFDTGFNLTFSAGLMMNHLELPAAIKPFPAFSLAAGWAF